jgi:hypothetical protein
VCEGELNVVLLLVDEREGGGAHRVATSESLLSALQRAGLRFETRWLPNGAADCALPPRAQPSEIRTCGIGCQACTDAIRLAALGCAQTTEMWAASAAQRATRSARVARPADMFVVQSWPAGAPQATESVLHEPVIIERKSAGDVPSSLKPAQKGKPSRWAAQQARSTRTRGTNRGRRRRGTPR